MPSPSSVNQWNSANPGSGSFTTKGYYDSLAVIQTSHTAGDTLVAYAAWSITSTTASGSPAPIPNPVANVSDDAHNYWIPLATSSVQGGYRCAIWVCTNAKQGDPNTGLTNVSVSLTSRVYVLAASIVEFTNMPLVTNLSGLESSGYTNAGTSASAGGTASGASVGFSLGAAGVAITTEPSSPWTALSGFSRTVNSQPIYIQPMWGIIPAGSDTATFGTGSSTGIAVTLGGVLETPVVPVLPNTNRPLVKVEAAFGKEAGDVTSMPVWTDITSYAISDENETAFAGQRGRSYELTQPEAGEITVQLNNSTGVFNPVNSASPFWDNALNANWDFETGTSPWVAQNSATLSQSALWSNTGTYSALFTGNGSTATPQIASENLSVTPGQSIFTASAWVYSPQGWSSGVSVQVCMRNSGGTLLQAYGSTVALPAGVPTFYTASGPVVAGTTEVSIKIFASGTPANTIEFFVDDAALTPQEQAFDTGLVALGLPVRVSALWNNRWHAQSVGYVTQLPQQWPEPQWGMTEMTLYDGVGVLANASLWSAYKQEVLASGPYAYWPLGESYSEGNGLPFGNLAPGNSKVLLGMDGGSDQSGNIVPLAIGQSLNLMGDPGTGVGISGLTAAPALWSAGLLCVDPDFPQMSNMGIEFWATFPAPTYTSVITPVITLMGAAGNYGSAGFGPVRAQICFTWNGTTAGVNVSCADFNGNSSTQSFSTANFADGNPHHFYINFYNVSGSPAVWMVVDGTTPYLAAAFTGVNTQYDISQIVVGASTIFCPSVKVANFTIAHVAIYSNNMSQWAQHHQAGSQAFTGETALTRFSHLMAWSGSALPVAGDQGSAAPLMGFCDTTDSQSVAQAIADVNTSEGGSWYVDACGSVFYHSRAALYDRQPKYVFGDNVAGGEVPFDPSESFDQDITYLFNRVQVQRQISTTSATQSVTTVNPNAIGTEVFNYSDMGALVTVLDPTSETDYAPRAVLSSTIYTSSDEDAYDASYWALNKYKQPALRVPTIVLTPSTDPTIWETALSVEQGDVVQVNRRPVGAPEYSITGVVQQVQVAVQPNSWQVTLAISPYTIESNVLQVGVSGYDTLGSNGIGW